MLRSDKQISLVLGFSLLMSGCTGLTGTARVWESPSKTGDFPEWNHDDFKKYKPVTEGFGIAFYGGGTRAAPAANGQLRMLRKYGWLDKANYISAISGGSWGVLPYIFLPENYHKKIQGPCYEGDTSDTKSAMSNGLKVTAKLASFCNKDTDELFFGRYLRPEQIDADQVLGGGDGEQDEEFKYSFSNALSKSYVLGKTLKSWFVSLEGDEVYADVLGKIFLQPFGLYEGKRKKAKYVAYSPSDYNNNSYCAHIDPEGVQEQPSKHDDFYYPRKGRPFFIAGTTLMRGSTYKDYYRYELTPLYVGPLGSHVNYNEEDSDTRGINLLVESCAFDSKDYQIFKDDNSDSNTNYRINYYVPQKRKLFSYTPFSLSDMLAASGAAPAHSLRTASKYAFGVSAILIAADYTALGIGTGLFSFVLNRNTGFPEFRYLYTPYGPDGKPVKAETQEESKKLQQTNSSATEAGILEVKHNYKTDQFGDGGHLENSGIMSLLARKVNKILVFVNTLTAFKSSPISGDVAIDSNLVSLFALPEFYEENRGRIKSDLPYKALKLAGGDVSKASILFHKNSKEEKVFHRYPHNAVFKGHELYKLINTYKQQYLDGKPLVHCQTYDILENPRYGIRYDKNYKLTICWVYLQRSDEWLNAIPDKVCKDPSSSSSGDACDLKNLRGDFSNFPNFNTFFDTIDQIKPAIIKKSVQQANALSQFTSWSLNQVAGELCSSLGLDIPENVQKEYFGQLTCKPNGNARAK